MSLNRKQMLIPVAKQLARELRKSSTPAEKIFWEVVRNRKFFNRKFYRQHPFFFDYLGKETFFIADFYCFEKELVVEIDGGYHQRQKGYDELRTSVINLLKIRVIRFTNDQIISRINNVKIELEKVINANSP